MIKLINNISGNSFIPQCFLPKYFLGQLIGGLLGMGSTAMSNAANARENQKNRDFQHDEAELSYQRQRTLIQEQNDYNSFSNQRKLMQEAGYNPYNLVGGTAGTAVSSSSTNAPQAGSSPSHAMQGLDPSTLSAISNIELTNAQTKKTNAEAGAIEHQNQLADSQSRINVANAVAQEFENFLMKDGGYRKRLLDMGLDLSDSQRALNDANRFVSNTQDKLLQYDRFNTKPAEYAKIVADTFVSDSQSYLNRIVAAKTDKERELLVKQFALQSRLVAAQCYSLYASGNASNAQASLFGTQNIGQGIINGTLGVQQLGAKLDYNRNVWNYNLTKKNWTDFSVNFINALKASIRSKDVYLQQSYFFSSDNWMSPLWNIFDVILQRLPANNFTPYNTNFDFNSYGR